MVVGEDRLLEVAGRAVGDEEAGGGGDGVAGVHDVPAVSVQRPGRRLELHRAERAGAGWPVVLAVAAFDFADGGQDGPRDAVLGSRFLEVGEVVRRDGGGGAAGGGLGGAGGGFLPGDPADRAGDDGEEQEQQRGGGGDGDGGRAALGGRGRHQGRLLQELPAPAGSMSHTSQPEPPG